VADNTSAPTAQAPTTVVTGAAGFAGRYVMERLAGTGRIVAWSRPGGTPAGDEAAAEWQAVDVTDRGALTAAIERTRPDRIVHLAGAASVETSWKSAVPHLRTNALGTDGLLEAVHRVGHPCRIVVVTSGQIYAAGDAALAEDGPLVPQSPYGLTKLAQDRLALTAAVADGLDVVVARPFNHIGPRQEPAYAIASFARQIARIERGLDPPTIRVGNLEARRDVTDVRDVADAYVRILEAGTRGRAYNVCSGVAWRVRDLLDRLLALSTTAIGVEIDAARLRPVDVPVVLGDAARLRTELGWTPRIAIEDTLRDTLNYWRARVGADA
jgi:GDP-4-dehydro-6-deoxy-D-mannose reductase